jgi:hypothetical protein
MYLQILEIQTSRLPEIQKLADDWAHQTEGRRTALRTVTTQDLDRPYTYLLLVEFPDRQSAMANSDLPETGAFAQQLRTLCDGDIRYLNLDVVDVVNHTGGTRRTVDCRDTPNEVGCTLTISGEPDELVDAAAQHAVTVHGHQDSEELRSYLRSSLREEARV